ncbi:hypothetical protein [Jatrophihabitans sp.]|uniref:hypothetical protein n=1 Tax=Jatrophihabitans sp. TaxID=1932789 RepID=UPI0030C7771A|nr:hypothetical protein [Jatrophihabitans sp.]
MNDHAVLLHLGLRHRGSQPLQAALEQLRPQLRTAGVAVITDSEIGAAAAGVGWRTGRADDTLAPFLDALTSAVELERAQVRAASEGRVVTFVSSTELLGPGVIDEADHPLFRPNAEAVIGGLAQALGAPETHVVIYTQRQDRLFDFAYLTGVMAGGFAEFAEVFPAAGEQVLDYHGLTARLDALDAVTSVAARPLESVDGTAGLLADLLTILGVQGQIDVTDLGDLPNERTYSRLGMLVALGMNPHLDTSVERERVRAFVLDTFPPKDDTVNRVVDLARRREILDLHESSNRALFARFGLGELPENYLNPLSHQPPPPPPAPEQPAPQQPAPRQSAPRQPAPTPSLRRRLRAGLRRRLRRLRSR